MSREDDLTVILDLCVNAVNGILHEPEGVLSFPYLDPGGPYSKSLWDWDSFWAATALLGIAKKINDNDLYERSLRCAKGAVMNFFARQGSDGSLPILLSPEDGDWFDSTTNNRNNMAKPVFGQFCLLLQNEGALDGQEASSFLAALARFYDCYAARYHHPQTGLYLWANDVAIGVDDDPATWGRPPFSSASLFLNCFLLMDLRAAASFSAARGRSDLVTQFQEKADALAHAIHEYCRDEKDGLYYSADVLCRQNLHDHRRFGKLNINLKPFWECLPMRISVWTCFLPLLCGLPDAAFAQRMREHLLDEKSFWTPFGIRTLSAQERMYSPEENRGNPSNWLGPIWIIPNYMIWKGLNRYSFTADASALADNTIKLLADDCRMNGHLHEYYNPRTGIGISGPGFMNWNLLACLMG